MEIVKDEKAPTYDPKGQYTWKGDDQFILTGHEFNFVLNSLRKILLSEQAQNVFLAEKSNEVLEKILAKAVQEGKVKEVEKEK